jgi:hypothetical protein
MWRLARDGREIGWDAGNYFVSEYSKDMKVFEMDGGHGAQARLADWLVRHKVRGMPQAPLLLAATIALVGMLLRRQWGEAILVAATIAFFMLHAAMLLPYSRYGVPAWVCWFVLLPDARSDVARAWLRLRSLAVAKFAVEPGRLRRFTCHRCTWSLPRAR